MSEATVLPIQENANAKKYGFATKLLPVFVDGVQTGWEQVHVDARATAVYRDSADALKARGVRAAFEEYDPILEDYRRHAAQSRIKPVWCGD